jgi:chemotaxis protein histidine kinase CheA
VTRPLPDELGKAGSFSGGAVLSNGEIALVVDCDALISGVRGPINLATSMRHARRNGDDQLLGPTARRAA